MPERLYTIAKPEMLIWARQYAYLSLEEAARRIGVTVEKLREWEAGQTAPTFDLISATPNGFEQS